ncbi:LytT sensor histidine kinase [Ignavibacterium album JCM 16511]|uniref:LytT sensor histidine kinase n=1 Tax=Ignavibacterium album (strain DSM 19864 / JCM 16511 / NBRC 101810 / Mat9-16) TaxID=945713 RepID=I0AGB3_IGNAJ|nr:histidine kinase [Ignavibacterium album]AFH48020.1 LytT sensor histidine kinase [Ignavibacterium album JCM 16511]
MNLTRNWIYWISQFSGWTLFVLLNIIISSTFEEFKSEFIYSWIFLGIAGLALSHLHRNFIRKRGWKNLSLRLIVPRILIASLILGSILFIFVFLFNVGFKIVPIEQYQIGGVIARLVNLSSLFLFWSVIYFAVHYLENYKKAEIESLIFEAAVKDFELKTLKAQLNPHFIFNAMNSIRALIEEDPESAKEAVTKLSNLMRYTLKIERSETVPLAEEIRTIKDYLDLEKIRFEERLNYTIDSTAEAERVEIPPMMIQTLVENGIKHGISKSTSGGKINIDCKIDTGKLKITIINTGTFNEEQLKNSKGFGVSNTIQRLNLLYGEEAFFIIKNINHNQVITEVRIPVGGIKHESFNY